MGKWLYSHLQKVKCQKWNTTEHKILGEVFNLTLMKQILWQLNTSKLLILYEGTSKKNAQSSCLLLKLPPAWLEV